MGVEKEKKKKKQFYVRDKRKFSSWSELAGLKSFQEKLVGRSGTGAVVHTGVGWQRRG